MHPTADHAIHRVTAHKLARLALFGFLMTFIVARVAVPLSTDASFRKEATRADT